MFPILVVDDDSAVRRVAVRALSAAGFDVLEARDGVAAVEVVERAPDAIQLVLTDLHMPRMSGVELIRVLNERWPTISVLAMTGYSDEREAAERLLGSALQVLSKPFTLVELNTAVRAAVTRASAA